MILRFAGVVFGLTSSPFLLNATIKYHLEKYLHRKDYRNVTERLIQNLYSEDSSSTFNLVGDAIQFYKKLESLLAKANFNLRKWVAI